MKKVVTGIFAIVLCLTMAACGAKEASKPQAPASSAPAVSEPQAPSQKEESSKPTLSVRRYDSIEAFIQSDMIQGQLEGMKANVSATGMSIDLKADGNKMIYCFIVENEALVAAIKEYPDTIKKTLDSQATLFEGITDLLKTIVDVKDPVVVVHYQDISGNVLYSQEFSGQS